MALLMKSESGQAYAERRQVKSYDEIYSRGGDKPCRYFWEGRIGLDYKLPKYLGYLFSLYSGCKSLSVLELGAGDGYHSKIVKRRLCPEKYVATDISAEGVGKMRFKGLDARLADATDLSVFEDNSFDLVFCLDVMHHVERPWRMAQEMLRVTRKHFFLCEANGICIPRKLLELTPRNRSVGEKSYTPHSYASFFSGSSLGWIKIKPFNFAFAFTPDFMYGAAVRLSEALEKVPALRWQGSSLLIYGQKRQ